MSIEPIGAAASPTFLEQTIKVIWIVGTFFYTHPTVATIAIVAMVVLASLTHRKEKPVVIHLEHPPTTEEVPAEVPPGPLKFKGVTLRLENGQLIYNQENITWTDRAVNFIGGENEIFNLSQLELKDQLFIRYHFRLVNKKRKQFFDEIVERHPGRALTVYYDGGSTRNWEFMCYCDLPIQYVSVEGQTYQLIPS